MVELLQGYGYTVFAGGDGTEALRVFGEHKDEIDLVILDAVIPIMGGRQVYEIIKEQSPKTIFLFISGYSVSVIQKNYFLDQGLTLLKKPFSPTQLAAKVRQILDEK